MLCQNITEVPCIVLLCRGEGTEGRLVCAVTLCAICEEMLLRGSRLWSAGGHYLWSFSSQGLSRPPRLLYQPPPVPSEGVIPPGWREQPHTRGILFSTKI
jgi:hypothetical protein